MCGSIWAPGDMSSCTLGFRRRMDKILFISSWNRAGALATPNGMTFRKVYSVFSTVFLLLLLLVVAVGCPAACFG